MVKRRRLKITSCEKCQKAVRVESRLLGDAAFTVMMPQGLGAPVERCICGGNLRVEWRNPKQGE